MSGTSAFGPGCQWLFFCWPMNISASLDEWDSDSSFAEPVNHCEWRPGRRHGKDQRRDAPLPPGPQLKKGSAIEGRSRSALSAKQAGEFRRRNDRGATTMVYSPSKKWPSPSKSPHLEGNEVRHHHQNTNHIPNEYMVVRVRTEPLSPPPPLDAIFIPSPAASVGISQSAKSRVRFAKYNDYAPDEDPLEVYAAVCRSRSNRYQQHKTTILDVFQG